MTEARAETKAKMGSERDMAKHSDADNAPGDESLADGFDVAGGIRGYVVGLIAAAGLTLASFWAVQTSVIYVPGVPVFLIALAIGQMGVHLVFFLHITTGPDNANNVLALAFGVLIVGLVLVGSIWIMSHLNHNMMPMEMMKQMQR
ncbi:cytochrome o ubiquinol oxidase subunit IV [uncultured Sphingomonas sp.]|uniref:cytochrome o ubiquinol oxidase subunit IV n=1 Tax=uncultured Sphingomonas sp. TaxID=158754 RepID=UPI0035CBE043